MQCNAAQAKTDRDVKWQTVYIYIAVVLNLFWSVAPCGASQSHPSVAPNPPMSFDEK